MPNGINRNAFQRLVVSTANDILNGLPQPDVVDRLIARAGNLPPEERVDIYNEAVQSVLRGQQVNEVLGELASGRAAPDIGLQPGDKEVFVNVTVSRPNQEDKIRSLRVTVSKNLSEREVLDDIEATIEEWRRKYQASDQTLTWQVLYILR